jgi:rhodanese-related sulfurtransferase
VKIDCEKLNRLQRQHVFFYLVDVRVPSDFQKGHIPDAINLPANVFLTKLQSTVSQKDSAIVIYDNKEECVETLVTRAEALGYLNIVSLEGGYIEFLKSRGP